MEKKDNIDISELITDKGQEKPKMSIGDDLFGEMDEESSAIEYPDYIQKLIEAVPQRKTPDFRGSVTKEKFKDLVSERDSEMKYVMKEMDGQIESVITESDGVIKRKRRESNKHVEAEKTSIDLDGDDTATIFLCVVFLVLLAGYYTTGKITNLLGDMTREDLCKRLRVNMAPVCMGMAVLGICALIRFMVIGTASAFVQCIESELILLGVMCIFFLLTGGIKR